MKSSAICIKTLNSNVKSLSTGLLNDLLLKVLESGIGVHLLESGNCVDLIFSIPEKDLPYLVASPCSHSPLTGEITIARFLCRTVLPDLYGNLMPEESALVDSWIDQSLAGSKERAAAIKSLDAKLGKQQWILGSKMSLADVVLASCTVKESGGKSVPGNVSKWLRRIPGLFTS